MTGDSLRLPTKIVVVAVLWLTAGAAQLYYRTLDVIAGVELVTTTLESHLPDGMIQMAIAIFVLQITLALVSAAGVTGAAFLLLKRSWARRLLELANWGMAGFCCLGVLMALVPGLLGGFMGGLTMIAAAIFGAVAAVFIWAAISLRHYDLRDLLLRSEMRRMANV